MNQARSTYKSDYVPYDWMQNNFSSDNENFCSSENIDECLRYISREFNALGYPSIYTDENVCELAINCDIVKLLNVTFDLLNNCREYTQTKEDLDCRNRCLLEDLRIINRKNSQLKENLEQSDRKYKSALEKERQSKEKSREFAQLLKTEKDECKRLSSQMQQQKKTYQHEIRKHENDMSQMKSRLNQMIADKNPDKKIANITSSSLLQRNSNQRGKWKTGSVAKSNFEEMYKSVISSYEVRCQEMSKEITAFQSCLEHVQYQILDIITFLMDKGKGNISWFSNLTPLKAIWGGNNLQKNLEERFTHILDRLKEVAFLKATSSMKNAEIKDLSMNSQITPLRTLPQDCKTLEQADIGENAIQSIGKDVKPNTGLSTEEFNAEKEKLQKEKSELSATASLIEKEKANLEVQKLEVIKMALHHDDPQAQWHQNLTSVPSLSVIKTNNGLTAVPCANQLRNCLSAPDQQVNSLEPLWKNWSSTENSRQPTPPALELTTKHNHTTKAQKLDPGLPKWAVAAMKSPEPQLIQNESNEDLDISAVSSYEEQNLLLLSSAMDDIEKRRKKVSS